MRILRNELDERNVISNTQGMVTSVFETSYFLEEELGKGLQRDDLSIYLSKCRPESVFV